jgi:benzoylformate decarboxylase
MKVSDSVFGLFRSAGMTTVFGNPGSTEIPMLDALPTDFRYVLGLQESIVVAMADGYAQASRRTTLASLHSAAGVGHGLGALFTAAKNQSPLVVVAGQQCRSMLINDPYLGATDAAQFPRPYVKWSLEPARAQDVPAAIARAIYVARQPPQGPVFVSVPMDDWGQPAVPTSLRRVSDRVAGDPLRLEEVAAALAASRAPAFVVGPELARDEAWHAAIALAERHCAPVWVSPRSSRNSFPEDHRLFAGFLPIARHEVARCLDGHDFVLVLGAPLFLYHALGDGPVLPAGTSAWHLTHDPDLIASAADGTSVLTDLNLGIRALLAGPPPAFKRALPQPTPPLAPVGADRLTTARVCAELASLLGPNDLVVEEAPSARAAMQRHLPMRYPDQFYTCASGGLGHGLPAAVGVALARPGRRVIALLGDGSAMFSIQGLYSAARTGVPVRFIVLNNGTYQSLVEFGRYAPAAIPGWARLGRMDFVAIAEGFGVPARRVADARDLAGQLRSAQAHDGPFLLEIPVSG